MAERHDRTDERRVARRTAERLVSLANQRTYGDRPRNHYHTGRRAHNIAGFMSIPANEMDVDDEDNDFGNLLDASTGVSEGARFNADLFEAYGAHTWPSLGQRMGTTPSPPLEPEPVWRPLGSLSNAGRNTWASIPTSSSVPATSLARHSSIRRPGRSRLVDFSEFTSRRRSTARDSSGAQAEVPESSSSLSLGSDNESVQTVRRFFPTLGRRLERRPELRQDRTGDGGRSPSAPIDREWSPGTAQAGLSALDYHQAIGALRPEAEERPSPRLRRGGVRPPETLWTHRYSLSAPTSAPTRPTESSDTNSPTEFILTPGAPTRPASPPGRENDTSSTSTEPIGYPTPGSVENEPASV